MYVKLFSSIYQGTLRGNSDGLLVFTNLLAHAEKDGFVDIHPRAISEEVGLSIDRVKAALLMLEDVDIESRSADEEGRRIIRVDEHRAWGWNIVNYVKYREIRNTDDRREQNRLAQEKFRQKKKADSNQSKPPSAHAEADTEAEADTKKKDTARKRAPTLSPPDDVSEQVWQDWVQLRKAKRASVTSTVVTEARKEAAKAGLTIERFLAVWCARGSQGLEADWLKPNERAGAAATGETAYQRTMRERAVEISPITARRAPSTTIEESNNVTLITNR